MLLIALVGLSAASLVLGLAPEWDIAVSRLFWQEGGGFWLTRHPALNNLRGVSMWPTIGLGVAALAAILAKIACPASRMIMPARMAVFFALSLLASSVLLVNVVLKEHWERARPVHITEFGGRWSFTPWWRPGDGTGCITNCSFISGEASGAAWLTAPALMAPPAWRPAALVAVAVYTAAIGALRIAYGGHFLSDVVLAVLATLVIVVGFHHWLYRRLGAPDEEAVAARLAAFGRWLRHPFRRS